MDFSDALTLVLSTTKEERSYEKNYNSNKH